MPLMLTNGIPTLTLSHMDQIKRYMLKLPDSLWVQLLAAAKADGRSAASAIRKAITDYVGASKK